MKKLLFVDYKKCSGCRDCEIDCAFFHEKAFNPSKARIQVISFEEHGVDIPVVCQQCEEAFCKEVCPVDAIYRDSRTVALLIRPSVCVGCRMCMMACPFGAVTFDEESGKMRKCDLCGGDPACIKHCATGAIQYITSAEACITKMVGVASKMNQTELAEEEPTDFSSKVG